MSFFRIETSSVRTVEMTERGARWLRSRYAASVLGLISFAESVFLPIIIDPFLIALILARPNRWLRFIVVSVVASTLGGMLAYWLGMKFFDTLGVMILEFYGLENYFSDVASKLDASGFVFVFLGAFTPIPYKIVALASGVLHIQFLTFFVASLMGRILRLGLVGAATHLAGPWALPLMRKYLHHIAAIVGVILIIYLVLQFV